MTLNFRKFIIAAIFSIIICTICVVGTRLTRPNYDPTITLKPLVLNPENPSQSKVGSLEFLNAWELSSVNPDFGGISALNIIEDGRFLSVSDAGSLIGFGLKGDDIADRPFIAPLPGVSLGNSFAGRDTESLAYDPQSGRFWVGFEYINGIKRFSRSFANEQASVINPIMKLWSANSGPESIVRLPDGRFLVFSEGYDLPDGSYEAILFSGDPTEKGSFATSFGYRPPDGYKPTDAALLPNGKIIILHRRISFPEGFRVKIGILDPAKIISTETVNSKIIATLKSPILVDNFEGITVSNENGKIIIWIISDNNFNILQRTILMKFALSEKVFDTNASEKDKKKPNEKTTPGFESLQ